jgi:hypothetical protein
MQDPDQFKEKIQLTMVNVMAVLYDIGIRKIHTGAIMRLLGVTNQGGHLGFFESITTYKQWFTEPVFEFLNLLKRKLWCIFTVIASFNGRLSHGQF